MGGFAAALRRQSGESLPGGDAGRQAQSCYRRDMSKRGAIGLGLIVVAALAIAGLVALVVGRHNPYERYSADALREMEMARFYSYDVCRELEPVLESGSDTEPGLLVNRLESVLQDYEIERLSPELKAVLFDVPARVATSDDVAEWLALTAEVCEKETEDFLTVGEEISKRVRAENE